MTFKKNTKTANIRNCVTLETEDTKEITEDLNLRKERKVLNL